MFVSQEEHFEMPMIYGYILGTKDGILIHDKFYGVPPTTASELAVSALKRDPILYTECSK